MCQLLTSNGSRDVAISMRVSTDQDRSIILVEGGSPHCLACTGLGNAIISHVQYRSNYIYNFSLCSCNWRNLVAHAQTIGTKKIAVCANFESGAELHKSLFSSVFSKFGSSVWSVANSLIIFKHKSTMSKVEGEEIVARKR